MSSSRLAPFALGLAFACGGAGAGTPPGPVHPGAERQLDPVLAQLVEQRVRAVDEDPGDAERHALLGLVYEANHLWAEARASFANARTLEPGVAVWPLHEALAAERLGAADEAADLLAKTSEDFSYFAPLHHRLGHLLLELGELERAEGALRRAVALEPNLAETHASLGDLLLRQGAADEARASLERALALDPAYGAAHFLHGRALVATGETLAGRAAMERGAGASMRILGDELGDRGRTYVAVPGIALQLALDLRAAGQLERAEQQLEHMLSLWPDDVRAHVNLAVIRMDRGDLDGALARLEDARTAHPSEPLVFVNLAGCLLRLGRPIEALASAARAVSLDPERAQAHFLHGEAARALDDPGVAVASLERAVELAPEAFAFRTSLAGVYQRLGRGEDARAEYEALCRLLPVHWQPRVDLFHACVRLGDREGARAAMESAAELGPGQPAVGELAREYDAVWGD